MSGAGPRAAEPAPIAFRIGHASLPADIAPEQLAAAIEAANAARRLSDLPDHLNPGVIDPAKAAALVAWLRAHPGAAAGAPRPLPLDGGGLGVGAAEPVTAAAIGAASGLVAAGTGAAELDAATDCALAARQAEAARAALAEAEALVATLAGAADADGLRRLSLARSRRAAIAQAWRLNAAAVVRCRPGDAQAASALAAAQRAVAETLVAPHTGMPG